MRLFFFFFFFFEEKGGGFIFRGFPQTPIINHGKKLSSSRCPGMCYQTPKYKYSLFLFHCCSKKKKKVMCAVDLTQKTTKHFISFWNAARLLNVCDAGGRHHLPYIRAVLWLPMGLFREAGAFFFLLFCVCQLGQALIVARRGEVSKKYSSPLNTPRAAESFLRPAHKAQRFSQQSTNSGVIMMLLVGRGWGRARGRGEAAWPRSGSNLQVC